MGHPILCRYDFSCLQPLFYYGLAMTSSSLSVAGDASSAQAALASAKPIVLIGLMGAGKTTIGRRLAKQLNQDFVDSDAEIEEAAACSISDIFVIHGEGIFRDLEKRVIKRLLEQPNTVIATGGGAWMQPEIREMIKQKALSIWLKADLETILERVEKRDHRPLLQTGDKRTTLQGLIDQRYPTYAEADLIVQSGDGPHENVVEKVIDVIHNHYQHPRNPNA
jgi:shikimate kinase